MKPLALLPILTLVICGCGKPKVPEVDVHPHAGFFMVAGPRLSETLPASIKDLQTKGVMAIETDFSCRFTAPDTLIDSIIATGYKKAECSAIASNMLATKRAARFSPKWDPAASTSSECYIKSIGRMDGFSDVIFLVVDRSTGVVHAVGEGPRIPPDMPK